MPKEVTDPKKKKFLKKHPILTDEQIKQKQLEAKQTKDKFTRNMQDIEKNLMGYLDIDDPLVDPETNKLLCWMKMPTMWELEDFYSQFGDKPVKNYDSLSRREKTEYRNRQYVLMSKMITRPKKDAEYWKKHSNIRLLRLFSLKLELLFEEMGGMLENFPDAT